MDSSSKIIKKKGDKSSRSKGIVEGNSMIEGSISNFRSDTQDPANVLSFGGTLENSMDQDQLDQIKQFVRESLNYSGPMESKKEILDLIESNANAYSQFNLITKIKYFYLKHEWTFITIRELIAITIIVLSFLLYSSSLKVETNYHNYNLYFYYPMTLSSLIKCISAGTIIGFIIFFMYAKWIFLEHLIYISIVYIVLISKNHGSNILNHGKYNFYIFIICSTLIFLILLSIHMIYRFSRTIKYLYLIIAVFALFFCFLICYNFKDKYELTYNCDKWNITLNSSYILDEKDEKCNIQKPKGLCYMDKLYNYFDLTLVNKIKCSNRDENEKTLFYNSIKNGNISSSKIFGFPFTNNINLNQKNLPNETKNFNINEYVFNNLINLENEKTITPETIIDFSSNEYGELKINFTKNQSLSTQRKNIALNNQKKSESLYDNVLMIFLSSTSRAHFQRAMPKLSKFISKLMGYEPFPVMTAYQFSKYNNFPFTEENIQSMFYQKSVNNTYINSLKYFKENGYITGQATDICDKEIKNSEEWDHENYAYLCDPNYKNKEKSPYERCLYGKPVSEYMINYATEFWDKYSDNKKYFRMTFNYGNEPTGNVLTYLDQPLYDMINNFYNSGKLKNTAVFIVSEQGNKNNGLYDVLGSAEFELEKKYGLFIMLLDWNDKFKSSNFHQNLLKNQNLYTSPYDVYESMIHIVLGNSSYSNIYRNQSVWEHRGESMFNDIHLEDRYCGK